MANYNQLPPVNNQGGNYNSQNGIVGNNGYQGLMNNGNNLQNNNGFYNTNAYSNYPYDSYLGRNLQQQQNNQFLKCRPVSSKEEAMAFQIDLDGSLWVFTDVGNGKIYTKQINNDGTATFNTYGYIKEEPQVFTNSSQFVTREELNKVVQNIMAALSTNSGGHQETAAASTSLPSTFE